MSVIRPESFPERVAVVIGEFTSEILIRTTCQGIKQSLYCYNASLRYPPNMKDLSNPAWIIVLPRHLGLAASES
jgi:hypothetical protein